MQWRQMAHDARPRLKHELAGALCSCRPSSSTRRHDSCNTLLFTSLSIEATHAGATNHECEMCMTTWTALVHVGAGIGVL